MPEETLRTDHHHHHHPHDRTRSSTDLVSPEQARPTCGSTDQSETEAGSRMTPSLVTENQATTLIDTAPMTLCSSLHDVIVLQVGGDYYQSSDNTEDQEPNCTTEEVNGCSDLPANDHDSSQPLPAADQPAAETPATTISDVVPQDTLYLSDLEFNNAYNLFKVHRRAITGCLVEFDNRLQVMTQTNCRLNFTRPGDRGLLLLDGSLVNLKELQLTGLTIGDETFDMIGSRFPRLTKLTVSSCKTPDQKHPVALESHYGLEELIVQDVNLADENFRRILPSLSNLKTLKLIYCNISSETMAAIFGGLPRLTCLAVTPSPSNGEEVTDEGLESLLECRPHMSELSLESVLLTDTGVEKIARCMPNLSKLKLSMANIGDDTVTLLAALNRLTALELRGTRATDDGLVDLVRHIGHQLEELYLESGSITECGLQSALPHLNSTLLQYLTIDISESTKRVSISQGENAASLQITVKEGDIVRAIVQKFSDVDTLSITSQSLSAAILKEMASHQTKLTCLYLTGASIDDDAAMSVLECFARIHKLGLYESVVTGPVICDVVHGLSELQELNFENKEFFTSETIVKMIARLKSLRNYQLYNNSEPQSANVIVSTSDDGITDLRLTGKAVDDKVLVEFLTQYDKVERVRLSDTSVTDEGIVLFATESLSSITAIKELTLVSQGIGDETLRCIGDHLPQLTELTLKSPKVTDDGLASLTDRLVGALELFDVSESNITDVGIRLLVTRMKSIRSLNVLDNPSVNEGIRDFLHGRFPEMGFVTEPQPTETDDQTSELVT